MHTVQDHPDNATVPAPPDPRAAVAEGLIQLATWVLRQDPAGPLLDVEIVHNVMADSDDAGAAEIEALAAALGVEVKRGVHLTARREFGPVIVRVAYVPADRIVEHTARTRLADAARWHVFCMAGVEPVDLVPAGEEGYLTEATAVAVRSEHLAAGCTGGHTLRLISGPVTR